MDIQASAIRDITKLGFRDVTDGDILLRAVKNELMSLVKIIY